MMYVLRVRPLRSIEDVLPNEPTAIASFPSLELMAFVAGLPTVELVVIWAVVV